MMARGKKFSLISLVKVDSRITPAMELKKAGEMFITKT
jgi:hypothetical protein